MYVPYVVNAPAKPVPTRSFRVFNEAASQSLGLLALGGACAWVGMRVGERLCGPSAAFYAELQSRFPAVEITVSGGISGMDDIEELDRQGLRSVIAGKALYEGRITLKDLARCLPNA